jgi:hypothetical protein
MSQAFVREGDDQWLSDVGPSVRALSYFLTRENNGIEVYELRTFIDSTGDEVYVMSNGLSYKKDREGKWQIAEDGPTGS